MIVLTKTRNFKNIVVEVLETTLVNLFTFEKEGY